MEKVIRDAQLRLLEVFSGKKTPYALAGGTALELCYLKHRFSRDLDFFSAVFNDTEIDALVELFNRYLPKKLVLDRETSVSGKARVKLYATELEGGIPFRVDFVEDIIVKEPEIRNIKGIRVYDIKGMYLHKVAAVSGTFTDMDVTGKELSSGRNEPRDVFDIYCISRKILPLHQFISGLSANQKRRMVQWYQGYSRQEVKVGLLDLEIYDKKFDSKEMIGYLDNEIKKFIEKETV